MQRHIGRYSFVRRDRNPLSRAGLRQDQASVNPRRPHQRVRIRGLKPLVTCHGRVLEPDTQMDVETIIVALFTVVMPSTTTRGTARRNLTGLRRTITKGLTRTAELVRRQPKAPSPVLSLDPTRFVRACPQFVHIEEYLDYEEEISRNPSVDLNGDPAGLIRISVPFDGGAHFGADARDDAALCLGDDDSGCEAVIGYLVFVEHEKTDLADVLGLGSRFGSHPLRLPIRSNGSRTLTR